MSFSEIRGARAALLAASGTLAAIPGLAVVLDAVPIRAEDKKLFAGLAVLLGTLTVMVAYLVWRWQHAASGATPSKKLMRKWMLRSLLLALGGLLLIGCYLVCNGMYAIEYNSETHYFPFLWIPAPLAQAYSDTHAVGPADLLRQLNPAQVRDILADCQAAVRASGAVLMVLLQTSMGALVFAMIWVSLAFQSAARASKAGNP